MNESESALELFLSGFTARALADPLLSVDETSPPAAIRSTMHAEHVDVIGLRRSGRMSGWVLREDVAPAAGTVSPRTFDAGVIVSDTAAFHEILDKLGGGAPVLFVDLLGQIGGVIRRECLLKPAMRMWLFGLVTITERRVTRMIGEICPRDCWQQYVSPNRVQKAKDLQRERRHRGQNPSLLDCLQFADKGQIVARNEVLRLHTRFGSRRAVETFVRNLQDLRNNLAHSQDLGGDWEVILELSSNLHRIVLGPTAPTVDAASGGL